ncbi:GS homeobox 2 [Tolypocladium paradoxum]|uniref:GS homeobox 2 n=1 Tax=Tolypocladium paradoxum TaxID=94208 RepID=A0A2S4KMA0_9HYPO|nr:GS homeobox 2 [Tolypocladium paradoxum]
MSNASPAPSLDVSSEQHAADSSPSHHESSAISQSLPQLDDTLTSGSALDGEKHPKGKRKRTAAKDKMLLEEAYKSNPKPDKQARLEIVDRVSLNEKEVQIWFQNRRQNDRRKSRPLTPEELAALRYGGMHNVSSDPVTCRSAVADNDRSCPVSDPTGLQAVDRAEVSPSFNDTSPDHSQAFTDAVTPRVGSQESSTQVQPETTPPQSQEAPSSQRSQEGLEAMAHSFSSSVGYLANRWNLGSSFSTPSTLGRGGDDSLKHEPFPPSSCSSDTTHNAIRRSQSHVRLSLSLEGKAELVSNQNSPTRATPPRPSSTLPGLPQMRRGGLQRSHSALPSMTLPPISTLTSSLPPRLVRGRSRNVHAWESCADSERRDELTAQAENESNGSAIAAISLLRSSSGILQPSVTKRNVSVSKPQQARQAKKAKLGRTISTYARLENVGAELEKQIGKVKVAMLVSPTDSDKENWSPDEDGNPHDIPHRRPLPAGPPSNSQNARRPGRALQENERQALLGNRASTAPSRSLGASKGAIEIFEDSGKKAPASRDDEVERFMRGEVSPSKKGDMDCVAGLLSLSQGAWR